VEVDADVIDEMYGSGKASILFLEGIINQFLVLKGPGSASALARVAEGGEDPIAVRVAGSRQMFGIETKNVRQAFAADLLMDPGIPAVSLMGMAGTGKTFLSLRVAWSRLSKRAAIARYLSIGHSFLLFARRWASSRVTSAKRSSRGWLQSTTTSRRSSVAVKQIRATWSKSGSSGMF
jgi:hypothetical protein